MSTRIESYTVGWICAIDTEYVAACELLDQEYKERECPRVNILQDRNIYTFGRIYEHHIVIACLPDGRYGQTSAALVAERMRVSFPALRFSLLVGIAGGAPSPKNDIRLGDVVVSSPTPRHGGVIQYDFGKAVQGHEFEETGHLAAPPEALLSALSKIKARHKRKGHRIADTISGWLSSSPRLVADYSRPDTRLDHLYQASYVHSDQHPCECQRTEQEAAKESLSSVLVPRGDRRDNDGIHVHYGLIATANRLMKDAMARDALVEKYNVLCFEMEAAVMNSFPCVVIRGICDYSDTHKNDRWQGYAAATAAAYAKELLEIIPGKELDETAAALRFGESEHITTHEAIVKVDAAIREYYETAERFKIERISGEVLPLEKCYINLVLQDLSGGTQHHDDKPSFSLKARLRLESSSVDRQVALDQLFSPRKLADGTISEPRRIFIQGRAGIGKTTLCKKIVQEFLHHRIGATLFDRLLWLPLRDLHNRESRYGWLELLQDCFSLSSQVPDWDDLLMLMAKQLSKPDFRAKTLLVLDGLDEVSHEWRPNDKVFKLLETIISTAPNIIITSRPQANSLKIGKFHLDLETTGFTPNQINTYIDCCVHGERMRSRLKDLIVAKPLLQGLLCIPIQLDAFCCIWSSDMTQDLTRLRRSGDGSLQTHLAGGLTTMTTLYSAITDELCRKDLKRIKRYDHAEVLRIDGIQDLMTEELRFLEVLAFQGLVNELVDFSPSHQESIHLHFKKSGNKLPIGYSSTLEMLSFLRTSGVQQHQNRRNYHFLHLTFQEFFAAEHFVRHWQTNKDLICLDLFTDSEVRISPFRFLQKEKYNPRYNIFWRFATGLTQLRLGRKVAGESAGFTSSLGDRSSTILLFDQLSAYPYDLLGGIHRRLLMYCLSEVVPKNRDDVRELRRKMEHLLHEGLIIEYGITNEISLGEEAEFPESILRSFLLKGDDIPNEVILRGLISRPYLDSKTIDVVISLMDSPLSYEAREAVVEIIAKVSIMQSERGLVRVVTAMLPQLEDEDCHARGLAELGLKGASPLPSEMIDGIIVLLKDGDSQAQASAARILRAQESLSTEIITTLIATLEDQSKDRKLRICAAKALEGQQSLSVEAVAVLITLLKHKNSDIRFSAEKVLKNQSLLIADSITILTSVLKDGDSDVRDSGLRVLREQPSMSSEAINIVITLLEDGDTHLERFGAEVLQEQAALSSVAIDALITLVQDEDADVRYSGRMALRRHTPSSVVSEHS